MKHHSHDHILAPLVDHVRQPLAPRAPPVPRAGKARAPAPRTPWIALPRPRHATWRGASAVYDAWLQPAPHARLRCGPQSLSKLPKKRRVRNTNQRCTLDGFFNLHYNECMGNHENIIQLAYDLHTSFRDSKAKESIGSRNLIPELLQSWWRSFPSF